MEFVEQPWEYIFRQQVHRFHEPAGTVVKLSKRLKAYHCRKVLDLGCGNGRHVVHLAQQGFELCGLDSSPTALHLTRTWLDKQSLVADLVLADIRWPLPFRVATFDALVSTQVIHHARWAVVCDTAREISRLIRPSGILLVTVSARLNPNEEYVEIEPRTYVPLTGREKGVPHHIFLPEELEALFSEFRIIDLSILASIVITLLAIRE